MQLQVICRFWYLVKRNCRCCSYCCCSLSSRLSSYVSCSFILRLAFTSTGLVDDSMQLHKILLIWSSHLSTYRHRCIHVYINTSVTFRPVCIAADYWPAKKEKKNEKKRFDTCLPGCLIVFLLLSRLSICKHISTWIWMNICGMYICMCVSISFEYNSMGFYYMLKFSII